VNVALAPSITSMKPGHGTASCDAARAVVIVSTAPPASTPATLRAANSNKRRRFICSIPLSLAD
jgi:hypothetical protein